MDGPEYDTANKLVGHLFRHESGRMTAILTRIFRFEQAELVEDIVQETFLIALKTWPVNGIPDHPSAWLMQVAKNRTINAIKRQKRLTTWSPDSVQDHTKINRLFLDHEIKDSQLRMLFACCYPELTKEQQIMLMLKTLSGFSNAEIAHALLKSDTAVKKALYRSKKTVQSFYDRIPDPILPELSVRLDTVYTGIYLMFTEGYKRSNGDQIISEDLCFEAVRLATLLLDIPETDHGKTHALLSLMYFSMARFPARRGNEGEIIDLKLQDRSLWDRPSLDAGFYHLQRSRESTTVSPYHLESTIASIHCSATAYEDTDWPQILFCYRKLLEMEDSGIVRLNYAIALSKVEGPEAGLKELDCVNLEFTGKKAFMMYAARAEMYAELQQYKVAKSYYQVACDTASSKADRQYLRSKMEVCDRKDLSSN